MAVYGESYSHSSKRVPGCYPPRYEAPMVPELRRKLKHERAITRCLGTTQRIEAQASPPRPAPVPVLS